MAKLEKKIDAVQIHSEYTRKKQDEHDRNFKTIFQKLDAIATIAQEMKTIKEETIPSLKQADETNSKLIQDYRAEASRYGLGMGILMVIIAAIAGIGKIFSAW